MLAVVIGSYGCSPRLGAGDDRRPLVEQALQGAEQPGLALAALAEQDDVVAGDQGTFELGDDGGLEAVQPGPRIGALAQGGEQVVADLGADRLLDVTRGAEPRRPCGCQVGSRSGRYAVADRRRGVSPHRASSPLVGSHRTCDHWDPGDGAGFEVGGSGSVPGSSFRI